MNHKYQTSMKSKLMEMQSLYYSILMERMVDAATSKEEIDATVNDFIRNYYTKLGRPITTIRDAESGHLPYVEDFNQTNEEISIDLRILFDEVELISDALSHYFNYAQNERIRLNNRVSGVAGLVNNLNLIANDKDKNSLYFKDSFTDYNNIETHMIMGQAADILTKEGVATLKRTSSVNRSANASIKLLNGNGEYGTDHIIRHNSDRAGEDPLVYLSNTIANDKPHLILDGQPNTVFEYQMVNLPKEHILGAKGYDFNWVNGKEHGDRLRLQIVIELENAVDVNWININPYHAPNSTGKVSVYSIRTSEDGFEYESLYANGNYVLNAELNITPQTYREDELFTGDNNEARSKFAGQGVWAFPMRKAKYVEIVFDQVESYKELIGHTYYERVTIHQNPTTGEQTESKIRIPSSQVPQQIINGKTGRHYVQQKEYIDKKVEAFEGWRYAIGIRDINIMSYEYTEKSELISKRMDAGRAIKQVMLYANEKIPSDYLTEVSKGNEWIQYYVTFDDITWHRISPMHHQPLGREVGLDVEKSGFPPKIYEINPSNIELESAVKIHKKYLNIEEGTSWVRLKVVMQRPTNNLKLARTTPILEEYSLRVILEEEE